MISKEEYLKAVGVIEKYHYQVDSHINKYNPPKNVKFEDCKVGEYLVCECISNGITSVTVGNKYKIVSKISWSKTLVIKKDNGKRFQLRERHFRYGDWKKH